MRNILHGQRYYFFLIPSKKTSNRPYVQFLSSLVEKERRVNSPIPGRPHRRPAWSQSLPPATHTRATGWRPAGRRRQPTAPRPCPHAAAKNPAPWRLATGRRPVRQRPCRPNPAWPSENGGHKEKKPPAQFAAAKRVFKGCSAVPMKDG